jgi:hypothetical protein
VDDDTDENGSGIDQGITWQIVKRTQHKKLFTTDKGLMGMAPSSAQVGDGVFVLMGSDAPAVLRPVEGNGTFKVVGLCYLHSFMEGESVAIKAAQNAQRLVGEGATLTEDELEKQFEEPAIFEWTDEIILS